MMSQLTTQEKYAIIAMLSEIMKADGIIHPKEEEYINGIYKQLDVSITDLEDIGSLDVVQAQTIIERMVEEKRRCVRLLFLEMAECDGYVHPKEMRIINGLFECS